MSDETWTHIKENFAKLSHSDKVDVVRKMTWFLDPVWESTYPSSPFYKVFRNPQYGGRCPLDETTPPGAVIP